jgi:hypothetical protein
MEARSFHYGPFCKHWLDLLNLCIECGHRVFPFHADVTAILIRFLEIWRRMCSCANVSFPSSGYLEATQELDRLSTITWWLQHFVNKSHGSLHHHNADMYETALCLQLDVDIHESYCEGCTFQS